MSDFTRQRVTVLELDLDKCANTYSVPPCTASGPAGSECYNTFQTCQDKPNFIKTVKTWPFVTHGAPVPAGETMRPYIKSVSEAPTEIDLDKGLAPRARVAITLADPPDSDIEADPYASTRTAPAGGTFWPRLLARNKNYAGRFARVKTAYFTDGWDDAQFITRLYVIENIEGPDSRRRVKVTLKDPVKLLDRAVMPAATEGKTASAVLATDLSVTLEPGQGALYPSSGHMRIGKEIIQFTGNAGDVLSWPDTGHRGKFGTAAAEHGDGAQVQLCQVWQGVRVHQVIEDMALAAGIPPANVDSAGYLAEDDKWLGQSHAITAVISEPEKISAMLAELLRLIGAVMWWDDVGQKFRFEVIAPRSPDEAPVLELTEAGHITEDSVKVERLDDLRVTAVFLRYALVSATADRREGVNYLRGEMRIDADAESANEYGDSRWQVRSARWFSETNRAAVFAIVSRRVGQFRDTPLRITLSLDAKDAPVMAGDLIDVALAQLVDTTGQPRRFRALVTRRRDEGGRIVLTLRSTTLGKRWWFWAPPGTGDYPADPEYAHWAADANGFPVDGSEPYHWF